MARRRRLVVLVVQVVQVVLTELPLAMAARTAQRTREPRTSCARWSSGYSCRSCRRQWARGCCPTSIGSMVRATPRRCWRCRALTLEGWLVVLMACAVSAARSLALARADVVLLVGCRLNWMFHFGEAPRWNDGVRIVQLEICADELHHNRDAAVPLLGDCTATLAALNALIEQRHGVAVSSDVATWTEQLQAKVEANKRSMAASLTSDAVPMDYYRVLADIRAAIPHDAVIVNEGANTMDMYVVLARYRCRRAAEIGLSQLLAHGRSRWLVAFVMAAAAWC